jgi:hypothetical protein
MRLKKSMCDSKATVLKTLNILHKKFQIGIKLQYQVVVGDKKSYDQLQLNKTQIFQCQFQKMKEKC